MSDKLPDMRPCGCIVERHGHWQTMCSRDGCAVQETAAGWCLNKNEQVTKERLKCTCDCAQQLSDIRAIGKLILAGHEISMVDWEAFKELKALLATPGQQDTPQD